MLYLRHSLIGIFFLVGEIFAAGPWQDTLVTKAPSFVWDTVKTSYKSIIYKNVPYNGKVAPVFAYYCIPSNYQQGTKLPAVVLVHGGGGTAFLTWAQQWAELGYAVIAMDLCGKRPNGDTLPGGRPWNPNIWESAADIYNCWYFHAVAAVLRATAWIATQPEVDPNRLGVFGVSWGGWNVCNAASVNNRYKAVGVLFGCGFLERNSQWAASAKGDQNYLSTFDPKNYLPNITAPMFWYSGNSDNYFSLDIFSSSERLSGNSSQFCIVDGNVHASWSWPAPPEIIAHFKRYLQTGPETQAIAAVGWGPEGGWATVSSSIPIQSAEIRYTTQSNPWSNYSAIPWQKVPVSISSDKKRIDYKYPTGTTVFYFNVYDANGLRTSTPCIDLSQLPPSGMMPCSRKQIPFQLLNSFQN